MKPTLRSILSNLQLGLCLTIIIAAATSQAADKPYPLQKCLVSGNALGSMGKTMTKIYNGLEIKFCCKPCVKKFEANKEKFLAKLPK